MGPRGGGPGWSSTGRCGQNSDYSLQLDRYSTELYCIIYAALATDLKTTR